MYVPGIAHTSIHSNSARLSFYCTYVYIYDTDFTQYRHSGSTAVYLVVDKDALCLVSPVFV